MKWVAFFQQVIADGGGVFQVAAGAEANRARASFCQWRNKRPDRLGLILRSKTRDGITTIALIDARMKRPTTHNQESVR